MQLDGNPCLPTITDAMVNGFVKGLERPMIYEGTHLKQYNEYPVSFANSIFLECPKKGIYLFARLVYITLSFVLNTVRWKDE